MNKAIIIGRLTRDPEMRTTTSGLNSTTFTVAVSRNYTSANGERETDFINCVAWRKQAENIAKYCTKGSQVAVEGRIQTRSYDAQDGTKRYVTEIIADNVTFLGDIKIIFATVMAVLKREGISSETSATMEEFMGTEEVLEKQ